MNWGDLIVDVEPAGTVTLRDMLKTHIGGCDHSVDHDAQMDAALSIAGMSIETYLDRIIAKRVIVEDFPHHFGTVTLHNPQVDPSVAPVVTVEGDEQDDYELYLQRGKVGHLSRIGHSHDTPMDWRKFDDVTVSYTAGYDPIPTDIASAIVYTAGPIYTNEGTGVIPTSGGTGEVKSMTLIDVGSMSFDTGSSSGGGGSGVWSVGIIPDIAAQMLSRYKRLSA